MISIIIDIKGTDLQIGNLYPIDYLSMISEGLGNNQSVVTLVRGGWAGTTLWSFVMVRRY